MIDGVPNCRPAGSSSVDQSPVLLCSSLIVIKFA